MLEILGLIAVSRLLAAQAVAKGHNAIVFRILAIVAWLGGEVAGGIVGAIVAMIAGQVSEDGTPSMLIVYPCALVGAAFCVGAMFLLVAVLPAKNAAAVTVPTGTGAPPPSTNPR